MKSKEELKQYRSEIETEHGECQVLTTKNNMIIKNCDNTSNRVAKKNYSWIDYWRAMTGICDTRLFCSSCGKVIYVGDIPKIMNDLYLAVNDSPELHKAYGGHIWVKSPKNRQYPGGRYITPLCPDCNNKHNEQIPLLKGAKICREIGATVEVDC